MDERGETETARHVHWQQVYGTKQPSEVGWFQERPDVSLALLATVALPLGAAIVDVGGGASTLVDHLLASGNYAITVLDISEAALRHAQTRLGRAADRVNWVAADITRWRPTSRVDLWHDRAVLHFLTHRQDQLAYFDALRAAVKPGGWALIAGFAPGGPPKCSGLEIVQHDAGSLAELLGTEFSLVDVQDEAHQTPWGAAQAFRYHLFRRS